MIDNNNIIVLETENLIIKKFQKTDFRNFLSLHQNPITMRYFDGGAKTLEQSKKRFNEVMEHQRRYGFSYYNIFLKDTNEYIGQGGLYYNYDMSINLCYALLEQFHNKGYATEAITAILKYSFEKLNISEITAMSAPENHSSRHLLEKIGCKFTRERTLMSGMTALCYSLSKEDFYKALPNIKKYEYKKAVGALLINNEGKIYFFQRSDFPESWQSPEGGIEENEDPLNAIYREIKEEIGIDKDKLELISETKNFYKYNFLNNEIRHGFIGQQKKFFLFKFKGSENDFAYKTTDEQQEFSNVKLISKSEVLSLIPEFKKCLYKAVLKDFDIYLK